MENTWTSPEFLEISVNSECTAYSNIEEGETF